MAYHARETQYWASHRAFRYPASFPPPPLAALCNVIFMSLPPLHPALPLPSIPVNY